MDPRALGERVIRTWVVAGMTQDGLARAVSMNRTAVNRLEKCERKIGVPEKVTIAAALARGLLKNDPAITPDSLFAFAKVSLLQAVTVLEDMGARVEIVSISRSEAAA